MRFLVLGCNGMAGHMISLYLKEQGHSVTGFAKSMSPFVPCVIGDARDMSYLKEAVGRNKYDSVINCIGILNRFAEDHHAEAACLNAYLPHYLAAITEGTDTQVIHMSTDCVFSGRRGQYTEDDLRDGESFYDRSKALGELEDEKNLTLRCSIVGPDIKEDGIGLMNWFLKQEGRTPGYVHAIWTGMTTLELAKVMEAGAREKAHGLYNMVPEKSISKYELLRLFNKYLRQNKMEIVESDGVSADKSLKRTRWDFGFRVPEYEEMVAELSVWMMEHKSLYPHYKL